MTDKLMKESEEHKKLRESAINAVPIPQLVVGTQDLARTAGKHALDNVEDAKKLDVHGETAREASIEEALQHIVDSDALDSQSISELTKESLSGKVESLETTLDGIRSGKEYSKVPQEIKNRIENVEWLASQARNRLDSMEGPGQEDVLLKASDDVSLAMFAMSTVPLAKQPPESGIAKFQEKIKELREMGIEERVGKEGKSYAELRTAATAASLEVRIGSNTRSISFAHKYLQQNAKSYSNEENKKIRKHLALAAQLNADAQKSLREGKLGQADALLSKSNALSSATMMYMGALGAKNSMRPPIKGKKDFEALKTDAAAEITRIESALEGIAALDPAMDAKELSAKTLEKFEGAQKACDGVQKKAAEAELLRFDASREGYVDKRLERASKSARELISAGEYEDANELIGIALMYKETREKSAYTGMVGKEEKKKTLTEKQEELEKKFGYSAKSDNLKQARVKLGRVLDELCPPEKKEAVKPMSEAQYERELASAKGLVKSVKKGLEHAQEARKDQTVNLLALGENQKKKPSSAATSQDIDLMAAYGLMGRANEAEQLLDGSFRDHLDVESEVYLASLDKRGKMKVMAKQDKLVIGKREELEVAGKDLAKQSGEIIGNVALKESFEEIEEREKEEGIGIGPQGESEADQTALAINGMLTGTLTNVMKQEARMASLHDATVKIMGGGEREETGLAGYDVSEIVGLQKEELRRSGEVLKEAGGMQAIGRSASTYLAAYRAGESRFWGSTKTVQMRDYVPRAMNRLYDAAGHVEDGKWKDASQKYGEAQGQFMGGFATASERKYDDPLIVEYKEKTQEAFDILVGKKEGGAEERKAAILALNATNMTVQTQYRGSQAFEGGLEHAYIAFIEEGGWMNLLGPAGIVASSIYKAKERGKEGAPKTTEEQLERIGYVPYGTRVARMETETEKVLSGKTSMFEKRDAVNNVRNDAAESLETYQTAQSLEDGLFTAASLAYQPIFLTEMMRDTARRGADVNTAILVAALATGKIGQFKNAVSEFAEIAGKGAEQIEKLSKLQKVAQHLKDPVELVHFAATGYLVVHGTAGAATEFEYFAATGDTRHLTAGVQSIAFQIPILTGFTAPMLRGGKTAPRAREKSLLGRMREQQAAEQKFREKLEKARPKEQREREQELKKRPEAPTGEKVKETIAERKELLKIEEKEWKGLAAEERGVAGPEAMARSLERAKAKIAERLEKEGLKGKLIPKETAKAKAVPEKLEQNLETLGITEAAQANAEQKIGAPALKERTNALMRTFRGIEGVGREVLRENPELLTQPQAKFEANVKRLRQTRKDIQTIKTQMEKRGMKTPEGMERDVRPYLDPTFRENLVFEAWRMEAKKLGITIPPEIAPAAEKAAPAEAKEYATRKERQVAGFMEKYNVERAEKTISENPPEMGETAKNRELRELALNRIAREPVEVRKVLKERIIENTPKELRDVMEMEWNLYVEGSITGLNQYSPLKEISGFTALKSEGLAPEVKADIDGFVRNANGANAHGIESEKGGHERFTNVILNGEIHQNAWVGTMKRVKTDKKAISSAYHGPFWVVLEGKADAVGGPITAEQHIAYVCPSEKYLAETSRAIKNAYSQGMLTRAEAVEALSKLMTAGEARKAPATAFRSSSAWNTIAQGFWAERRVLGEGEIVSFERFSRMEVKKVAAKPKENIVERSKKLRAEEKRTGMPSMELARMRRQIEQNPELKKAVEEFERTKRVLARAESGKQIGAVGDIKGIKAEQIKEAEAAKAKAAKDLADAEATAKPAEPSPGMTRAGNVRNRIQAAKQRLMDLVVRRPVERMKIRKMEKAAQVLTPEGKRIDVPQEQAGNPTRMIQDAIFKSAIPDAGMRNAIGLERGRILAESAWADVYKGEAKPAFRNVLEKDAYAAMEGKVQARFDQVVDYAWKDTIREKTKLMKGTKKPSRVNDAEIVVYLRMKKVFNTIWEANVKRKGMNKKSVEKMIKPQELAADYRGYLQRGAGMPKDMIAKVKEMGIETTIPYDGKYVTEVKNPSAEITVGDMHGDHVAIVTGFKEAGFIIDTRPDLAVGDKSVSPADRYIVNKEIAPGTQFTFLGDYIDRGPHSLYAVEFVQWFKGGVGKLGNGSNVHTLKGNHEAIFTRVFETYKNKSTAEVEGLIKEIDTYKALKAKGKKNAAKELTTKGQMGELKKEGVALERVGTEEVLREILDKYGTWETAVVEMQKDGGLIHFIENTKGAVIMESREGRHLFTHGGPVVKTAAREADGTLVTTISGDIVYDPIRDAKGLDKHYEHFFEDSFLNRWAQNDRPTDPKIYSRYAKEYGEAAYAGDYSTKYAGISEEDGGWLPKSSTSKGGENLDALSTNMDIVSINVGHHRGPNTRLVSFLEIGNRKKLEIICNDGSLSEVYMGEYDISDWGGGIQYKKAWGAPEMRNGVINGRKNKPGTVEKPSEIREFNSPIRMEGPYSEAWEQTEGAKRAEAADITAPVPTVKITVPAAAPPAPVVPTRAPMQKPAGIMPKRPTKQIAPAKAAKKGYQEMPENIEKWVDPETGMPWSKLVDYMENGNYSKKFTIPVEIEGKTGEWVVTIEGATRVTGEEMYWYTVSSSPTNIDYRPGQTTGAVVVQKGASLRNLITKNIQRSFKKTDSRKKTKE